MRLQRLLAKNGRAMDRQQIGAAATAQWNDVDPILVVTR
jgi:hypothetical protein